MQGLTDTIVAPITAIGGAVAVVRVSGPNTGPIVNAVLSSEVVLRARYMSHVQYSTGDDGLTVLFSEGASYTGEDSAELSVHGSPASVAALIEACVAAGSRVAAPGEFTYRAFMNGRLDLTQAEGVRDTVMAHTEAQLRQANLLRQGALRSAIDSLRDRVVGALAAIEVSVDFSEEIGHIDRPGMLAEVWSIQDEVQALHDSACGAQNVREGFTVAIAGRPNAGKSSLLNACLRADRAIVTDVPGTTRDTLEEAVSLRGMPVRLIDTAGLRSTQDPVEAIGVERALTIIDNADLVWFVFDQAAGWHQSDRDVVDALKRPFILVANKCDLPSDAPYPDDALAVSCVTRAGLEGLVDETLLRAGFDEAATVNLRHKPLLKDALEALGQAAQALDGPVPDDLATVGLRAAARSLGEITGDTAPPDVIERVFHDFCIGK